jgi:hypothetical protein
MSTSNSNKQLSNNDDNTYCVVLIIFLLASCLLVAATVCTLFLQSNQPASQPAGMMWQRKVINERLSLFWLLRASRLLLLVLPGW